MPSSPENEGEDDDVRRDEQEGDAQAEDPGVAQAERDPREELAELQLLHAQMEDRYKRALADLDNYRKRSARELERRVAEAREALLRDWLLALDSLERALRMEPPDSPALSGLQAVLEQMEAILERYGVSRIGATGERFDPERHEAVGVHNAGDVPDRTIVDVARSGFVLGDRVLRPAEVIVARGEQTAG
jgi:molecular chaperone GrpE